MTEDVITFNGKPIKECSREELIDALIEAVQSFERSHRNFLALAAVNEALIAEANSRGMRPTCH